MFELIIKLHTVLNNVKGFIAGYGTKGCDDRMYINYNGKHYMLKLVELDPIEVTDMDRRKHESNLRLLHVDESRCTDMTHTFIYDENGRIINVQ